MTKNSKEFQVVQSRPTTSALASIPDTLNNDWDKWTNRMDDDDAEHSKKELLESVKLLHEFIDAKGDITHLLDEGTLDEIGMKAVDEWNSDKGSIAKWRSMAAQGLKLASQNTGIGTNDDTKNFPFEGCSDVHLPLLIQAAQHFNARVYPELVRDGDTVMVKVFEKPSKSPDPMDLLKLTQPPQDPAQQQAFQAYMQQRMQEIQQQEQMEELSAQAKNARGKRVAEYLNWYLFYKTQGEWESDTDLLLNQIPVTGIAFKKIYMGPDGLRSEYISPMHLTVHKDTKSMNTCPRITQDYTMYPYEILQAQLTDRFRYVELPNTMTNDNDDQSPRELIEQFRMIDLDNDGLSEPYLVTVDVQSKIVLRIEPTFSKTDIIVNNKLNRIGMIKKWNAFVAFQFMPDPEGNFYGSGYAKLLAPMTASIDTSINQLIDAGTMQVAGGGFIGGDVRFAGTGQAGALTQRPGEWLFAQTTGGTSLKDAIVPMTVPNASEVTMQLTQMLIESAKDITGIKDVMTGDTATTAPVGTTFAVQQQALTQFTAIYKRVYRGFKEEFKMIYDCLQKWATDVERNEYAELTGGDFDADFAEDSTSIAPVADPTAVTSMQKTARIQALTQFAESAVGQAAGMTQPGPAAELAREAMQAWDVDRPDRFIADIPPNPAAQAEMQVKAQEVQARAQDLQASAALKVAKIGEVKAGVILDQAKAQREIGLSAVDSIALHREADHIKHSPLEKSLNQAEMMDNNNPSLNENPQGLGQ